jgi:hypothetical protein
LLGLNVAESELPFVPSIGNATERSKRLRCSSIVVRSGPARRSVVVPLTLRKHQRLNRDTVTVVTHSKSNLPPMALIVGRSFAYSRFLLLALGERADDAGTSGAQQEEQQAFRKGTRMETMGRKQ